MNRRIPLACTPLLLLFTWFYGAAPAAAAEKTAAELLPETTVLYAELTNPAELLETVMNHPVRKKLDGIDDYQKALQSDQMREFQAVLQVVETQIGMDWQTAVKTLTGGGVVAAVDAHTEGVVVMIRATDEQKLTKTVDTLLELARTDAANKGNPDPIQAAEYRGISAYRGGKARMAVCGPWLLITNKNDLGKLLLDNYLDGSSNSLANAERFRNAKSSIASGQAAWAYADLQTLREAGVAKELFKGRAENPGAELLVGGILSTLQQTPYATACLEFSQEKARLRFSTPHQADWVAESREYFFGPASQGRAPSMAPLDKTLFSLRTYRDIAEMWLRAGDLFDENANDEMAKAESNLSTLFSGKDFAEEVLGAFQPQIQFIATRQDFSAAAAQPAIKLPAFAAIMTLKDPETMRPDFQRTFKSLIGFLNVIGAQNGHPQLDWDTKEQEGAEMISAYYSPDRNEPDLKRARIHFNFSPSVAFVGDRMVISSSRQLSGQLVTALQQPVTTDASVITNTEVVLNVPVLRQVLDDNRSQLIAQNMLEEGRSREEAEKQIGILMSVLDLFRDARITLAVEDNSLSLDLAVRMQNGG